MGQTLVPAHVRGLKTYKPGPTAAELEQMLGFAPLMLAANENPRGPSPRVVEAMQRAITRVNSYPDNAQRLRDRIADHHRLAVEEVVVGNGSNELITLIARTFTSPGDSGVLSAYPFVMFGVALASVDVPVTVIPRAAGLVHNLDAIASACDDSTKIIFLANPNNPTGTYVSRSALRRFLETVPQHVVVMIDEAYAEYVDADDYGSAMTLRDTRERLLISRTFSKCYALAGLRVGYVVGPVELVRHLQTMRDPFNCNAVAQLAATAALDDQQYIARSVAQNIEARTLLVDGLTRLDVESVPSEANFVMIKTPFDDAEVATAMRNRGVVIQPLGAAALQNALRVTVPAPENVARCLDAFSQTLNDLQSQLTGKP